MSKSVKDMLTSEIQARCEGVESACIVDISRLDAINANEMRGELKKEEIHMHVVKNSLARRAFAGGPLEPLAKTMEGPCAIVYGAPAATDIAKILAEWAKKTKTIELKQGIMDGDAELLTVDELSKMKGRLELLGDIAMLTIAPARNLASALVGAGGQIAGCLKTIADKDAA
jgi:large subunit ribosomal protein L10